MQVQAADWGSPIALVAVLSSGSQSLLVHNSTPVLSCAVPPRARLEQLSQAFGSVVSANLSGAPGPGSQPQAPAVPGVALLAGPVAQAVDAVMAMVRSPTDAVGGDSHGGGWTSVRGRLTWLC